MSNVYLSLGSNQGDSFTILNKAISALGNIKETKLLTISSFYKTPAWGKTDQSDFLNLATYLETELDAQSFLQACQKIERDLGRVRHEKWGPRTIDIDILLFDHLTIHSDNLIIPHPYMTQRAFVLVPLLEINPKLSLDGKGDYLKNYLDKLDQSDIILQSKNC
ncbi:2-amino-4-hydroxy-6-hydroxymethyldihydropteridine diphosphokinase [Streptococcus iniae]|uniref:2-amino-4-hydroxy-6- hydroxymethyldihydropteridine diphosphokinase n=1 Tax=Streptococcus iniae TaxID=1346 RepID=UPI002B28792C|nr:2-amino-4-hydroxy-6-hydroxymethyldihydropteridine diphosphokinase [Streptococcus iniae]WNZ90742.1 2-amino-4-hydroxy-6-hydroxymethyldihydropteridine diphosphokinase [Streptococcus iniae]WNZ90828.1 2-amino-4-hydroxy-6-hydroxymethyldihydropteridine diphosphokinase [Streptococcus iniae]WNZ93763.1 2-amino-4-hydroxy-6-hydroxymethyldihydropteridine diphosphokinase [Streptococcus iniae]WNZ94987.1 2-amino-4-hydroxy-6-hydroxymethyldihydropteridine diphosphokinase [Streptococcus iniae]